MNEPARYLIAGCGYVGARLARALLPQGPVVVVTRTATSAAALAQAGFDAIAWDIDSAPAPASGELAKPAVLFYLVPPPATGATDPRITRCLQTLPVAPTRVVYLSTTGVYGDTGGGVVDEEAPLNPMTPRAERRVDAETRLRTWCDARAVPWTILRVPGIYGPGRLPLERLRRQEPSIRHAEAGYSNRIHVDDLVDACVLAAARPAAMARIFNVTDGNAATMTEYLERVATLAGLPTPPLVSRAEAMRVLAPGMMSFLAESRRIDSGRIRRELGFTPRYADLRLGILSSLPGN